MEHQGLIVFHWGFSSFVTLLFVATHWYFRVKTHIAGDAPGIKVPVTGSLSLIHNNSSCIQEVHILHCD